jgi:peptide methionine sulfoxide reductase msrA/msrB
MKMLFNIVFVLALTVTACTKANSKVGTKNMNTMVAYNENDNVATLAGGCFWCIEAPFEKIEGVSIVISGYAGGTTPDPSYKEVASGQTDYREAVQVYFDPAVISYNEILDVFWKQFDPTDDGGSFYDRGHQYTSAVFYHDENQKVIAEYSKSKLDNSGIFNKQVVTPIKKFSTFYPAEEYHQDYYKKDPERYYKYRKGSGRDKFIMNHWKNMSKYSKPKNNEIKEMLTETQYQITQKNGTERAFKNEYWNNKEKGIYVDIVSGEPLFSSADKFKSGTGWPSFTKPVDPIYLKKIEDISFGMKRVEVRSKLGDSHLGHVFNDGPEPTKLRYCINSASLRFISMNKMKENGYGEYLWLIE